MPFTLRPYRRFPVQCAVTYNAGPFQGQGTVWNLSCTGWRLSGDLPMRPGETLSLTFPLPNDRCISKPVENLLKHGENSMVRTPRTTGEPRAGCSKK